MRATAWGHGADGGRAFTIDERLRELADERGDDPFVVLPAAAPEAPQVIGFAEFRRRSEQVAALLASLGVGKGDALHVHLRNGPEFLACLFGAAELGAVVVPTNPSATVDDVAYVTSHASCSVSIAAADLVPVVGAAREMVPDIDHIVAVGGEAEGAVDLAAAAAAAPRRRTRASVDDTDVAAVLYTSGVTGWPKGVMITHANLLFVGEAVAAHLRLRPDDRWLVTLPLFHMNALGYSTMSALSAGAAVSLVERFEPEVWAGTARHVDATVTSLFAVHVRQLLDTPAAAEDDANRLRLAMFAQHLTADERARFRSRFSAVPIQVYGLTETVAPTLGDPPYGRHRPETVARALPWAPTKVADRAGRRVPDGSPGELLVGGEPGRTLMAGYYRRPEQTALVMRGGWLRTGDQVVVDASGCYRFLGRAAEVIKPGVDNVSAAEVERVLFEHVAVADAAVVGTVDEAGNESIVAFVVLQDEEGDDATAAEIVSWAGERLADYKVPSRLELVASLPRNAVGKVLKRELQRLA